MSENPHAHAGLPRYICETGAQYECIPCTVNLGFKRGIELRAQTVKIERLEQQVADLEAKLAARDATARKRSCSCGRMR